MLVRVIYSSAVQTEVSENDIRRLVASARRRNRQADLTGALLVSDGQFAQAIEGSEGSIDALMRKIELDPRHSGVRIHERKVITRRLFADWDMAFVLDSRCDSDFRDLISGCKSPDAFAAAMAHWIEEVRSAPH